jgi:hypothetical protein
MNPRSLRGRMCVAFVLLAVAAAGCAESAPRQLRATPQNVTQVLASARDGDTVILGQGLYEKLRIPGKTYAKPLVIDARAATIEGLGGSKVDGLEIRGGNFRIPPPFVNPGSGKTAYHFGIRFDASKNVKLTGITMLGPAAFPNAAPETFGEGTGVLLNQSESVEVSDSRFAGLKNGVVLSKVSGFRLLRNMFEGQRSDGMAIGEGRSGLIEGNECRGTRLRGGEHPDCIQMFSRPTSPPTADIVIRKNKAVGQTQGIGMFNKTRDGVNDGGFDRILIEDNEFNVWFPNGIGLTDGRASIVRNNVVETYPGAPYPARIVIRGVGDVVRCGNVVKGKAAEKDRPC